MSIKIVHYTINNINFPKELSGYRIALFSDTHEQDFGDNFEKILKPLNKINPDIVLFAGDAVNKPRYNLDTRSGYENSISLFERLARDYKIYYINGNHDLRLKALCEGGDLFADCYMDKKVEHYEKLREGVSDTTYEEFVNALKSSGVHILSNSRELICDGGIAITGLEIPLKYYRHKSEELSVGDIRELIGEPVSGCYNILLAHSPQFFESYASWGADLTLCGHIHGGAFRLPIVGGILSPYRTFFPKYDYGHYSLDGRDMIVSSGAGDQFLRGRITNPTEIVDITFTHKE